MPGDSGSLIPEVNVMQEISQDKQISTEKALEHLKNFRFWLSSHFVSRQQEVDLLLMAAVAEEPILFVGPPGTAKSDLITRFRAGLGVPDEDYFEYMLTKFTEPSEILGPLDLARMKEGAYIRRTGGKLPEASVVFLDEIFKANSAILNTLLTVLNERKFYQDGRPVAVKARIVAGASNEIPQSLDLDALKDRFILKIPVKPVPEDRWTDLLQAGLRSEVAHRKKDRASGDAGLNLLELAVLNRHLVHSFRVMGETGEDPYFPAMLQKDFQRIARTLRHDFDVSLSDRRLIRLYKLIRSRALILRGGGVEREDLELFCYMGNSLEELELLERRIPQLLS